MEAIIAIVVLIGLIRFTIWIGKLLWNHGILQRAFGSAFAGLLSGIILFLITGDPGWGAGGGISLSLFSFVFGGEA